MMIEKKMVAASIEAIVLALLARGDTYGYEIIREVRERSDGAMDWAAGSLYPVLHRMQLDGTITSYWEQPDGERRRRYYQITAKGRQALAREKAQWLTVHNLLEQLWGPAPTLT